MLNIIQIDEKGEEMDKVIEEAMAIIDLYPDIFPHMYKQGFRLVGRIQKGNLILQDGVVITFSHYSQNGKLSKNATTFKKKGDFIIHQIASDRKIKGATQKVLDLFVEYCRDKHAENIILTVRKDNTRARKFYERNGFKYDSDIHWTSKKTGIIEGVVYKLSLPAKNNLEKFM